MNYHEFAFFCPEAQSLPTSESHFLLQNESLLQRLIHVIRVDIDQKIILFTHSQILTCCIKNIQKKSITLHVLTRTPTKPLTPEIHWYVPIIAKEHFEEALYMLTALGATSITPLITEKTKRTYNHTREQERLERIMIAAMEQAKQFTFPQMHVPQKLSDIIDNISPAWLVFDAQGNPCFEIISSLKKESPQEIMCLVGPEGDFSEQEKIALKNAGATFCALTPTILRTEHAIAVAMGCLRSLL